MRSYAQPRLSPGPLLPVALLLVCLLPTLPSMALGFDQLAVIAAVPEKHVHLLEFDAFVGVAPPWLPPSPNGEPPGVVLGGMTGYEGFHQRGFHLRVAAGGLWVTRHTLQGAAAHWTVTAGIPLVTWRGTTWDKVIHLAMLGYEKSFSTHLPCFDRLSVVIEHQGTLFASFWIGDGDQVGPAPYFEPRSQPIII